MPRPRQARSFGVLAPALLLAACATPRLYSPRELSVVAERCNIPPGDLGQEPDFRKVLFLYTVAPSEPQLDCVHKWARKNRLHLAYFEAVDWTQP